jgi:hypothetical protein
MKRLLWVSFLVVGACPVVAQCLGSPPICAYRYTDIYEGSSVITSNTWTETRSSDYPFNLVAGAQARATILRDNIDTVQQSGTEEDNQGAGIAKATVQYWGLGGGLIPGFYRGVGKHFWAGIDPYTGNYTFALLFDSQSPNTVEIRPHISFVSPSVWEAGQSVQVTVQGQNFGTQSGQAGILLSGAGLESANLPPILMWTSTTIMFQVQVPAQAQGGGQVVVRAAGGQEDMEPVNVNQPPPPCLPPIINSGGVAIIRSSASSGWFEIYGYNLGVGGNPIVSIPGATLGPATYYAPYQVNVPYYGLEAGKHTLTLTTSCAADLESFALVNIYRGQDLVNGQTINVKAGERIELVADAGSPPSQVWAFGGASVIDHFNDSNPSVGVSTTAPITNQNTTSFVFVNSGSNVPVTYTASYAGGPYPTASVSFNITKPPSDCVTWNAQSSNSIDTVYGPYSLHYGHVVGGRLTSESRSTEAVVLCPATINGCKSSEVHIVRDM